MFLIRADGNEKSGAGHLMRCLTIAGELAKLRGGEAVLFVCADEQSADLAKQHGFQTAVLGTDYRDMEAELPVWERSQGKFEDGRGKGQHLILVDSYFVTDRYLEGLRHYGTVALLDDMGRRRYPVDVIINYNVSADPEKYHALYRGMGTRLFVGSAYTPVREQFLQRQYQFRETVRAVLITAGGGDEDNIAGKLLACLLDGEREFHLVAGQFNPHLNVLRQVEKAHENVHIHCNVKDMAGLMSCVDLAFTAGGSTIYELAVLGVPFICFSCAPNQEALTEYIDVMGIAGYAGAYHREPGMTLEKAKALYRRFIEDGELRRQFQRREREMVDGLGALRLAQALEGLA